MMTRMATFYQSTTLRNTWTFRQFFEHDAAVILQLFAWDPSVPDVLPATKHEPVAAVVAVVAVVVATKLQTTITITNPLAQPTTASTVTYNVPKTQARIATLLQSTLTGDVTTTDLPRPKQDGESLLSHTTTPTNQSTFLVPSLLIQ